MDWDLILLGTSASAAAGIATGVGALPVFVLRSISPRVQDAFLGFAAGVMLAASFFSLILPGSRRRASKGIAKQARPASSAPPSCSAPWSSTSSIIMPRTSIS